MWKAEGEWKAEGGWRAEGGCGRLREDGWLR